MSRTPTMPPNDHKMWRKLVARAHPDSGGDHDLFIWSRATMEAICAGETDAEENPGPKTRTAPQNQPSASEPERVPFDRNASFTDLTRRAVAVADEVNGPYGELLRLLADCHPSAIHEAQEQRGASYKQLAAIGHKCEMVKRERVGWYRLAESVPLSDRHAGHILSRLKKGWT